MKKVLILGLALIFSGSILASTFEAPPEVNENPIVIVATDYNDFTESFIVDSVIVNPNITADIVIAIKEAYVDSSYNKSAIFSKQENYVSNGFNDNYNYTYDDWPIIALNDNNLNGSNSFEHEDPGETNEVSYKNLTDYNLIKNSGESPPKLE